MENASQNIKWMIIFEIIVFIQIGSILFAVYNENYLLIYSIILIGTLWAYYLFKKWNTDERTDSAIDNASRSAIQIFLAIIIPLGLGSIIYSQFVSSILWEIGASLIVIGLFLFSLHALLAVHYENTMR